VRQQFHGNTFVDTSDIRWYSLIAQEITMRVPVRKMGNASGVILPKPILTQLGVEAGDELDLSFNDARIVLVPSKRHPRAGWADAAKRIADAEDDAMVWPEFGNAGDTDLKW
jgi:antitoxin MazE